MMSAICLLLREDLTQPYLPIIIYKMRRVIIRRLTEKGLMSDWSNGAKGGY